MIAGFSSEAHAQFNFFVTEPPDKAGEYLGFCKSNAPSCEAYLQKLGKALLDEGEKNKKPILCIPKDAAGRNDYERIHRWVVLRPERHGQPTKDVLTDAMKAIYPCTPEKPAEKKAKAPAKTEKSEKK